MLSYLQSRRGHYHLRLRTPADLVGVIPRTEITKSLKTADLKTARTSALSYLQGIQQTAALLRSRFITPDEAQERLTNLLNWQPRATLAAVEKLAQKSNTEASMLSVVIQSYLADKEKEWTAKTKMENAGVFKLILDLMGDVPVESIDRGTTRDFKARLLKTPPNVYKVYPSMSPLEVLQKIDSGELQAPPMSITSVNKHLTRLHTIMTYCVTEKLRSDNPATDLHIKQKRRKDEERKAYSREDLQRIIKHLPQDTKTPERFWIPLVCMLSGMRLDEACQLYKEDIKLVDGVWCIDVNDSKDKKLKNLSSKRVIPIHPRLIELGLIDYMEGCKTERLWNNLTWCKVNGYSNLFGKWFQRFNRKHVTDDPLKTFHSLRHSFADNLKQLQVQETLIAELMGHANDSMTTGRYGKRYRPHVLAAAVAKVRY